MRKLTWIFLLFFALAFAGCSYMNFEKSESLSNGDGTYTESSIRVIDFSFSDFFNDTLAGVIDKVTNPIDVAPGIVPDVVEVVEDIIVDPEVPVEVVPVEDVGEITEIGTFHKRTNGDRPLWYFKKIRSEYPVNLLLTIKGCAENLHVNKSPRWDVNMFLVKQSNEPGRKMAVHAPSSCMSKIAYITYTK